MSKHIPDLVSLGLGGGSGFILGDPGSGDGVVSFVLPGDSSSVDTDLCVSHGICFKTACYMHCTCVRKQDDGPNNLKNK